MGIRTGLLVMLAVLVAVSVGSLSGTVAAQESGQSTTIEVTVTEDGDIETLNMTLNDDQMYELAKAAAEDEGYDSAAVWYAESSIGQNSPFQEYSDAEDREVENGYVMDIRFTEVNVTAMDLLEITAEEGSVSLELSDVADPASNDQMNEITYVFDMPYEITDSNAYSVDDTVATWHLHEEAPETLFVESETLADDGNESDETDGNESNDESDEDDSNDGLPGFGPVVAIVGLLAATMLVVRSQE